MNLTRRQQEVYSFLEEYFEEQGTAPSYEEIRQGLGLSSLSTVFKHLKQLERKGYLRSPWASQKRALALVGRGRPGVRLPLLGAVAAGEPIEAVEVPDQVEVPESLLRGGECFALKVKGDSMIEDGIHDGDLILVKKQESAENGQTVVALIEGEATVKKFFRQGKLVELRPANPAMEPITVAADQVKIQGVVIGLMRTYR
ncbi:MAG: repressor LexA [Deltaproteobacteria bacterium RBG_13_61_14]|nr:MAG: repressor LexA [Deltaproteobacteria bacterium RBG_13_61_14]